MSWTGLDFQTFQLRRTFVPQLLPWHLHFPVPEYFHSLSKYFAVTTLAAEYLTSVHALILEVGDTHAWLVQRRPFGLLYDMLDIHE